MPTIFEFDDDSLNDSIASNPFVFLTTTRTSVSGVDEGVTFTLTVNTTGGFTAGYSGGAAGGADGQFFVADVFETPRAPFTAMLTWTDGNGNSQLGGDLQARLEVNGDNLYQFGFVTAGGTQNRTLPGQASAQTVDFSGQVSAIKFTFSNLPGGFLIAADSMFLEMLSGNLNCFVGGTGIATPTGQRPVEALEEGDEILTADGRRVSVTWVGQRRVDTRLTHPDDVNPICISAGTLGNMQDVWVSKDHGIAVDGYLINAGALVNGDTIYQVNRMPREGFSYYHIETAAHELILAEGLACESYLDMPSQDAFENARDRTDARMVAPMDLPRISSRRMLPDSVAARLAARPLLRAVA